MHAELANRKDEIAGNCRRYRMSRLVVFGSAARGTDFNPESSAVDFMVEFEPPTLPGLFRRCMGLNRELRAALGRKVDLLTLRSVKNQCLQEAIDRSREVAYDRTA